MLGTLINVAALALGGLVGLLWSRPPGLLSQQRLRVLLGACTIFFGFQIIWRSLSGSIPRMLGQVALALLALVLGRLLGRALHLQKRLNRVGQFARERLLQANTRRPSPGDAFAACAGLFCLTPLAVIGSLHEGLTADFRLLAVKAVMEALAMQSMIKPLGPAALGAAVPVLAFQGTLTIAARAALPWIESHGGPGVTGCAIGLLTAAAALMMLEIHKVIRGRPIEMADYLPSLIVAPLLAALLG